MGGRSGAPVAGVVRADHQTEAGFASGWCRGPGRPSWPPVRRRLILILAWALSAAGCARRQTAVATGIRDQVLHFGNRSEPADLDPMINNASDTGNIENALFEGLVGIEKDGTTVIPGVAERWEISADGLGYTFHLRKGARWSNGAAMTSRDFLD